MNKWGFRCFHCQRVLQISQHGFCSYCTKLLDYFPYCTCCGSPLPEYHNGCGNCQRNEMKWHQIVQVAGYKSPLTEWIHRFKFHHQYSLDESLARLMLLAVKQAQRCYGLRLPEVILPVPLHWQRQWQRGYNQAWLISQYLAKWLNIPVDHNALQRIKATTSQRELTARERHRNLRKAFRYQPSRYYQRVGIFDDVVTTGSTLNAICVELLKQKVQEIQVWTLARA